MSKVVKSEQEWKAALTPEEFHILRQKGTERAFTGKYNDFKGEGVFRCAGCGAPLFDSHTKYNSGSGWPSFTDKISQVAIDEHRDGSHGNHAYGVSQRVQQRARHDGYAEQHGGRIDGRKRDRHGGRDDRDYTGSGCPNRRDSEGYDAPRHHTEDAVKRRREEFT